MSGIRRRLLLLGVAAAVVAAGCSGSGSGDAPTTVTTIVAATATTSAPASTTSAATAPTTVAATTTTRAVVVPSGREMCLDRAAARRTGPDYVLPFVPGTGHTVLQSYCHDDGSHEEQLAVDFTMPIGTPILAARAGVVVDVETRARDDSTGSLLNFVVLRHDDGQATFYAHLREGGVFVEMGDEVAAGEVIGESGDTGRTAPVLHFQVFRSFPPRDNQDIMPVFTNLEGALDELGGLREGGYYRALP